MRNVKVFPCNLRLLLLLTEALLGWHLPGFDDSAWTDASPLDGVTEAGVQFYRTTFGLSIPEGVDYPISLVTSNATDLPHFRSQVWLVRKFSSMALANSNSLYKFYVNGYQFGKYSKSRSMKLRLLNGVLTLLLQSIMLVRRRRSLCHKAFSTTKGKIRWLFQYGQQKTVVLS